MPEHAYPYIWYWCSEDKNFHVTEVCILFPNRASGILRCMIIMFVMLVGGEAMY